MPLDPATVHAIRTGGRRDSHWAAKLKMSRGAVRDARTGRTWSRHPTPPDVKPRLKCGGRPRKADDSSEVRP